jgi:uncharacterized protein (DUF488 family)
MYSKNGIDIISYDTKKFLGKKINRMENIIKPINKNPQKPPKISKKTLLQIEKVILGRKKQHIKFGANQINDNLNNISTNIDSQKYKLPELSLKEKYQDLLNRKELILPPKYRLLLKKQNFLDDILIIPNRNLSNNIYKIENNFHPVKEIQINFNKKINVNFTNKDFQQILYICPFYYIYQSIKRITKGIELKYIDIPKDYVQRMNKKYNARTNFKLMQTPKIYETINNEINKAVMEKRKKLFKKILINITLEQHQKFLKENNLEMFDPVKAKTWHHNFDLKNVDDIGAFPLVENNIEEYKKLLFI